MLLEYVYGDRPEGPPKRAGQVISTTLWRLRRDGYPVGGVKGRRGYVWDEHGTFPLRAQRPRSGDAAAPQGKAEARKQRR